MAASNTGQDKYLPPPLSLEVIAQDRVPWIKPPAVMGEDGNGKWEKWVQYENSTTDPTSLYIRKRSFSWKAQSKHSVWYDRSHRRVLHLRADFQVPLGVVEVETFGCPAPQDFYYEWEQICGGTQVSPPACVLLDVPYSSLLSIGCQPPPAVQHCHSDDEDDDDDGYSDDDDPPPMPEVRLAPHRQLIEHMEPIKARVEVDWADPSKGRTVAEEQRDQFVSQPKKRGALSQNAELQAKLPMVTQHADNTSAELRMRLAEAEKKREGALSQNAELQAKLQMVTQHADNTSAELRMRLAEAEKKRDDAVSKNAELEAQLQLVAHHADNTSAELHMRLDEAEKKRDDALSKNAELEAQLQLVAHHADNTSAELHMRLDEAEKKRDDVLRQNAELQAQLQLVRQYADNSSAELRLRLDEAEKKKDDARRQNAELQIQLQLTTQNADNAYTELRMRLESALSDAANTRADLSLARTDGDQARADRDRALQEVSSAQQQASLFHLTRPTKIDCGMRCIAWRVRSPLMTPLLIAHFLQHNEETNFKGIPTSGPEWVIDLRDVRGYREVESRVPGKVKGEGPDARFYRIHSLTRVLEVLAVPGKYSALLSSLDKQVAPIASLTPCVFGPNPFSLSDGEVAALLADKGLTVALADDSWQYCYKHLEAHAARPDQSTTKQLLMLWNTISAAAPAPPPGLQSPAADRYPRTVPSKIRKGR
ncbi:hypothetical protein C8F04DRAFT_1279518 [Mycena alexandri]|uniref:Uncharacterized protein n=1 Tax=Mycena alexandri TaxID=1745969 RepID=A0AAD6RXS9_9AGAR|nr:hypothetical protein C8F04DRAFT_1279518 [Mycena alexandri]